MTLAALDIPTPMLYLPHFSHFDNGAGVGGPVPASMGASTAMAGVESVLYSARVVAL